MKFWKVRFDDNLDGFGWLVLSEELSALGLYTANGELITGGVSYTPVEFDTQPEWAETYVAD